MTRLARWATQAIFGLFPRASLWRTIKKIGLVLAAFSSAPNATAECPDYSLYSQVSLNFSRASAAVLFVRAEPTWKQVDWASCIAVHEA
jgi:hypothetical protein